MPKFKKTASPAQLIDQLRVVLSRLPDEGLTQKTGSRIDQLVNDLREDRKVTQALLRITLMAFSDQPVPIKFFASWASYSRFNQAEHQGTLKTLVRKNGKILIRPSDFFIWFDSLPADKRRKPSTSQ